MRHNIALVYRHMEEAHTEQTLKRLKKPSKNKARKPKAEKKK